MEKKNGLIEYLIGLIIILGITWILVALGGNKNGGSDCWKDYWGSIECYEDPRS